MKNVVITILGLALCGQVFAGKTCSKEITMKEVKRICSSIVKKGEAALKDNLHFENCGPNYAWIQDASVPTMNMVMHPISTFLNGKSLNERADRKGKKLFAEFDKAAKAKPEGAWVDYLWKKKTADVASKKISFVKLCKGPGKVKWIVGSGVWQEDL